MITINIEIKNPDKTQESFHKLHNRIEDTGFSIIQKIPEKFIPPFIMDWLDRYLTKRLDDLKQQQISQEWHTMALEKVVEEIHANQDCNQNNMHQGIEKAPSGE